MPGPKTPCDLSQLTPVIENALKNAKVSKTVAQGILDEVGATQTITGWVTYVTTDTLNSSILTYVEVQQYNERQYERKAIFACPPNPLEIETELKRAHSLGLMVMAVYTIQKDERGLISSLAINPPFTSEPPWKR